MHILTTRFQIPPQTGKQCSSVCSTFRLGGVALMVLPKMSRRWANSHTSGGSLLLGSERFLCRLCGAVPRPSGEQSMSSCPRQSRAQARRVMLWQSPKGAKSISHRRTSCLHPAAHSTSQLSQGC